MISFHTLFENYVNLINDSLIKYLPQKNILNKTLIEAMEYSIMAGGKRIRPIITLAFCKACGGNVLKAMPFACAIEMIHTYSLIHDDLPCMDDDDFRRGKPACHIAFGESAAVLTGDAFLTRAFEIILSETTINDVGYPVTVKAALCLAKHIGVCGMLGGQIIDIENEGKSDKVDIGTLNIINKLKTGALICSAAEIGCIVAGADKTKIDCAKKYADSLGLAYQIVDDILDTTSTKEKLGKNIGSDKLKKKITYVTLFKIEKSRQVVKKLSDTAINALEYFDECDDTKFLKELVLRLSERDY